MQAIIRTLIGFVLLLFASASLAQEPEPETAEAEQSEVSEAPNEEAKPDPRTLPPDIDENGRPGLIDTAAFAGRSELSDAKLSPDGSRFAFVKTDEGTSSIVVVDADTLDPIGLINLGKINMRWFRWAGENRILMSLSTFGVTRYWFGTVTTLRVYDLEAQKLSAIEFEEQGFEGDDVLFVDPIGRFIVLSRSARVNAPPAVYRYPLDGTGEAGAVLVQKPEKSIDEWWADDTGVVRMGAGITARGSAILYYRPGPGEEFERIVKLKRNSDALRNWNAQGFFAGSDNGYALVEDEAGRMELRRFDYSTSTPGELVYANKDWDVENVISDPDGRPLGIKYVDDQSQTHWLDPRMAKIQSVLEQVLGGNGVRIISQAGTKRMLVYHTTSADPGVLYVYTPQERRLEVYSEMRPQLDFRLLAQTKPISYSARDGVPIRAFLTLPRGRGGTNLPLIILPHGGPYGVRDQLQYNDEVQLLANRGYAVLQPNYRGSGGYGESFVELGEGQIGLKMQDDLDDARAWAVSEGIADPDRVCMVGGSYGGYAALWAVIRNPELYRCAASWAGVTDWKRLLRYDRNYLGREGHKEQKAQVRGENDLDLKQVSPLEMAVNLDRPVLIAHGKNDRRVPFDHYETFVKAAEKAGKPIEKLELDEGHSFSKAENEQAWYDALSAFLIKHNPPD